MMFVLSSCTPRDSDEPQWVRALFADVTDTAGRFKQERTNPSWFVLSSFSVPKARCGSCGSWRREERERALEARSRVATLAVRMVVDVGWTDSVGI